MAKPEAQPSEEAGGGDWSWGGGGAGPHLLGTEPPTVPDSGSPRRTCPPHRLGFRKSVFQQPPIRLAYPAVCGSSPSSERPLCFQGWGLETPERTIPAGLPNPPISTERTFSLPS